MSFAIKFITRRSSGGEIVRLVPVDKAELAIGRATDSDIYLPDLRVGLAHARLVRTAGQSVALEALGDNAVTVGGQPVARAVLEAGKAQPIGIGPYGLTVLPGDEAGQITVRVEQTEAPAKPPSQDDEIEAFALKSVMPTKRLGAWVLGVAMVLLFLVLPVWAFYAHGPVTPQTPKSALATIADRSWNSGAMSMAHQNLADNCKACHVSPFVAVLDQTCMTCHNPLKNHAKPDELKIAMAGGSPVEAFHALGNLPEGRCGDCHKEHNGKTGLAHASQQFCADCHQDMGSRLTTTKLGNVGDFLDQHPEFSPTLLRVRNGAEPEVLRLPLTQKPQDYSGLKFPHDVHLKAGGGVARQARQLGARYGFGDRLECADCHTADAGGALFETVSMEKHCAMCHSLVFEIDRDQTPDVAGEAGYMRMLRHGEPKAVIADMTDFYLAKALAGVQGGGGIDTATRRRPGSGASIRSSNLRELAFAQAGTRTAAKVEQIFNKGGACYDCHQIVKPTDGSFNYTVLPVRLADQFMPKAMFSHTAHETANMACETCHAASTSKVATDVLMPDIASCRTCHGGEHATGLLQSTCTVCHDYHISNHAPAMTPTRLFPTKPGQQTAAVGTKG